MKTVLNMFIVQYKNVYQRSLVLDLLNFLYIILGCLVYLSPVLQFHLRLHFERSFQFPGSNVNSVYLGILQILEIKTNF